MAVVVQIAHLTAVEVRKFMQNQSGFLVSKFIIIKQEGQENYWGVEAKIIGTSDDEGDVYNKWQSIIQPDSDQAEQNINKVYLVGNSNEYKNLASVTDAIAILDGTSLTGADPEDIIIAEITLSGADIKTVLGGRADTYNFTLVYENMESS